MCGYFCVGVQPAQPAYGCSSEPQCVEEAFHKVKSIPVSFSLRFIFFLKIMCMCLWVGGVVHVSAGARRRPEEDPESEPLKLELLAVGKSPMRVLGADSSSLEDH